jgi:DNA-binding winged helix-turn-helix (wHTH) protein
VSCRHYDKENHMNAPKSPVEVYRFDDVTLDATNRRIWHKGEQIHLNSKYFDVLLLLVRQRGRVVEKQRIFDEVWNGIFVTDAALTQCIKDIRRQLGDDAANPRYIKTVPKHGYIFIAEGVQAEDLPAAPAPAPASPKAVRVRPYKFLDSFTEQDAGIFFGREAEVEIIRSRIVSHRSFILHGRSGVGKTSIVRAGLIPRLKAEGHLVFGIRCFTDPLRQMTEALGDAPQGTIELESILRHLIERSGSQLIVFVFDQFEEFFSVLDGESQQSFITALRGLVSRELIPLRAVFVLREDLLAEMSSLKAAIPDIFHHEYRLQRFGLDQAARAIVEPASLGGCEFEGALLTTLLADLNEPEGVDPPQLQIVCDTLYDFRGPSGVITLETYQQLGGASRILTGYLSRVLSHFKSADLQLAREILKSLISDRGERRVVRETPLLTGVRADDTSRVVEDLVAARVMRRGNQDGEGWLELAHDFLLGEVRQWLTAEDRSLKRARAVVERALENYRVHRLLLDADTLDLLLPYGEQLGLTGEECDLLTESSLARGRRVPSWLLPLSPSAPQSITNAMQNESPAVRVGALETWRFSSTTEGLELVAKLALRDADFGVRKAASVALASRSRADALDLLSRVARSAAPGPWRRAVSLAIIRDHDPRLASRDQLSLTDALLVGLGRTWLRLQSEGRDVVRQGTGGMLGGGISGLVGSFLLGLALTAARREPVNQAVSLIFVLASLGTFVGALGGLGVSLGMCAVGRLTDSLSRLRVVAGGAAGGALIGGSTKILGIDTLKALFGQNPSGVTGAFEGAVIGFGTALGFVLIPRARLLLRICATAAGAMAAGVVLAVMGGNLFSGSLEVVAHSFADSRITMDPLAYFFGEVHFGRTMQIVLGAMEGLLFGAGVGAGIELSSRRTNG